MLISHFFVLSRLIFIQNLNSLLFCNASITLFFLKVKDLNETAERLMMTHPDQAQNIHEHQQEINEKWNKLTEKADARRAKLLDSYDFQRFLSDFR